MSDLDSIDAIKSARKAAIKEARDLYLGLLVVLSIVGLVVGPFGAALWLEWAEFTWGLIR